MHYNDDSILIQPLECLRELLQGKAQAMRPSAEQAVNMPLQPLQETGDSAKSDDNSVSSISQFSQFSLDFT
jgi:hypothetical protein